MRAPAIILLSSAPPLTATAMQFLWKPFRPGRSATPARTCFTDDLPATAGFLGHLDRLVAGRRAEMPEGSYTTSLFTAGKARVAQKVGEEGVELALARMKDDRDEMANEAADLLYHMLVLLADADMSLADAVAVLKKRHG